MGQEAYRSLKSYFKEKYGTRVQKITVSLPFTCPHMNEDGSGGCTYCHRGSLPPGMDPSIPLAKQIIHGISAGIKRYGDDTKFLVYYQSYTNTNAPVGTLKEIYSEAFNHPGVIGIDVGTRPDCVGDDVIKLIDSFNCDGGETWMELGLQSASDETLKRVNRGHTVADFLDAVYRARNTGIKLIAHVMVGLPGEDRGDFLRTASLVASLKIFGIKIHPLYIMEGTDLGDEYNRHHFKLLAIDEYIQALADIAEILPPEMVMMRFTAEGDEKHLIAPNYCRQEYKERIKELFLEELQKRGTRQGSKYKG
jgi:radical SAM protein (TIGR01212 family)